MNCQKAQAADMNRIVALYDEIIAHTENMAQYARWKKGLHPTEQMIKAYIDQQAMYLLMDGAQIAGAMAVTMQQSADYHAVAWTVSAEDDEAAVIHILGVNPQYQRKGIGRQLVEEAIRLARGEHKKALRLDALASNLPAQHMYTEKGFVYCGKQKLYAENTGWTDFYFYEYALS